jgi:hypothetical protein
MIKPADFDPAKKYPVIMHQYSGPYSQKVKDSWAIGQYGGGLFESYMASNGFIMVCVDGRGTAGRGTKFGKCTYMSLGVYESKDQVEAAKYLGSLPYVDKNNIAIYEKDGDVVVDVVATYEIRGQVVSGSTPISSVLVSCGEYQVYTDDNGNLTIVIEPDDTLDLLPGTYYYAVKIHLQHDNINPETNENYGYVDKVSTVINKTKLFLND